MVDGVGHVEAMGTDGVVDQFEDRMTWVGHRLEAGTCATGSGTSISAASR